MANQYGAHACALFRGGSFGHGASGCGFLSLVEYRLAEGVLNMLYSDGRAVNKHVIVAALAEPLESG